MKKRVTKIMGIGFLVAALAVPAVVLAQGWRGGQMMGNRGMGPGSMMAYDRGYGAITPEQRTQLDQLNRQFYDETVDLRKDLWNKSSELNTILNGADPDIEKVKALNTEINDLRGKLNEKSLNHQLEARKVTPDSQLGGGYGRSYGNQMGGSRAGMMGRGQMGPGMMGAGPMRYGAGCCQY